MLRLFRIATEILGLISVAYSQPRVRHHIEQRLGPPATDVALAGLNAFAQALSHGPLGLGGRHRKTVTRGTRAAGEENDLGAPGAATRREAPQRGSPFRRVPVAPARAAEGTDRAVRRSRGGILKAATIGRAFAAHVDRVMSERDVITMDPAALRRLDRVDTLVVVGDLVASDV
jgi:cation-transporting ATPase I